MVYGGNGKIAPGIKIAFCGCVAQQGGGKEVFKRAPYVDLIMGTHNINEFPDLIKRIENDEKIIAVDEDPVQEKDFPLKTCKKELMPGLR